MAQWLRALYCSASCAIRDSGLAPRLCRNRPRPGRSVGRRTIGLASSGLGRVWPVGISLSHRAPATPVAGRAQGCQVHGVSSVTLVRLASGLDARCVKKQCGLVGYRRTHDSQSSSLPSPYGSCSDETR